MATLLLNQLEQLFASQMVKFCLIKFRIEIYCLVKNLNYPIEQENKYILHCFGNYMLQTFICERIEKMIQQQIEYFQDKLQTNGHLELDFGKKSLNTTCTSNALGIQSNSKLPQKQQKVDSLQKTSKNPSNTSNKRPIPKQKALNKKSTCFTKQISKVLKKNKFNHSSNQNKHTDSINSINYLNPNIDISCIHFKANTSSKGVKTNNQIKTIITQDRNEKENFNFEIFLQNMVRRKQNQNKLSVPKLQDQKDTELPKNLKSNTPYLPQPKQTKTTPQTHKQKYLQNANPNHLQFRKTFSLNQPSQIQYNFNTFLQNAQHSAVRGQSKFQIQTARSSRIKAIKLTKTQNKQQNKQLQRCLKRAMSNVSSNSQYLSLSKSKISKTWRPNPTSQLLIEKPLNHAQKTQFIHFDKLKSKVMSKMQDFKKIKQIRDNQQKQIKKFQKKRTLSNQPTVTLTIEGKNLTLNKNESDRNNLKEKDFRHKRPYTALSRTGLEFDRRDSYRRQSDGKQRRISCLAGVNNSANHYRTFSKNGSRQIQQLEECRSDRVVRQLREKYTSRPQTAKPQKLTRRQSKAKVTQRDRHSEIIFPNTSYKTQMVSATRKQIEKQKIKLKLLGLLVECEEEKAYNENLKQGLNIFEDYCVNIDQGLKSITQQIDQYIKKDQ